ncbi:hypothetical protein M2651_04720 [Clostridium sp. SYSU_GA19001]|uniref:sugar ABC transporter substrate-binding protein n=1 Tax=Clostridium caldaquaticum TaxID=2940653 RepID=UPI002077708B|nr:hypothetical protein [Clostridium caldaquaticum]MCM8710328.1 hypothetical protein [Clostridium caldaquaticum]
MKKRLVSLVLAGLMTVGFAGCKNSEATSNTNTGNETKKVEKYGKETIKIAVETYDPTASQFITMQKYFKYLQNYLNVEFIYSEKLNSAEDELAFIESAASAGAKGVIGYYNVSGKQAVQKAVDLGMYYYGAAENTEIYSAFKTNKYYLGGVNLGKSDYEGGYAMTKGLIDAGCKNLILSSGGANFGVPIFVERVKGAKAAIEEANKAGKDVKIVKEVPGFPDEAFFAAQAEALGGDVDGVIATFGGSDFWFQPIETAGKKDKVKIATIASIDDAYKTAFEEGRMASLVSELTENFAMAIPMIVNAVEGNSDVIRQADGSAANFAGKTNVINDKDTFNKFYKVQNEGIWAYGGEDMQKLVKGFNKDVKYEDYQKLISASDINSIFERRGVK